jgi:hypothetical protein
LRPEPLRIQLREDVERLLAVRRVTYDLEVRLGVQECEETTPNDGMIIDDQDPDRVVVLTGHR